MPEICAKKWGREDGVSMNGRKHNLPDAVRKIAEKKCGLDLRKKRILIPPKEHIGIKAWGVIDFLCVTEGFSWAWYMG